MPLFDVVFQGELQSGQELQQVKLQISQRFKIKDEKLEQLFSGKPIMVRRGVDAATAQKFRRTFMDCGARCRIQSHNDGEPAPPQAQSGETQPGWKGLDPVARKSKLLELFSSCGVHDFATLEGTVQGKLQKAVEWGGGPVLAVLDRTAFGSWKDPVLFGSNALEYRGGVIFKTPLRMFYTELAKAKITLTFNELKIVVGSKELSFFDQCKKLQKAFTEFQTLLLGEAYSPDKTEKADSRSATGLTAFQPPPTGASLSENSSTISLPGALSEKTPKTWEELDRAGRKARLLELFGMRFLHDFDALEHEGRSKAVQAVEWSGAPALAALDKTILGKWRDPVLFGMDALGFREGVFHKKPARMTYADLAQAQITIEQGALKIVAGSRELFFVEESKRLKGLFEDFQAVLKGELTMAEKKQKASVPTRMDPTQRWTQLDADGKKAVLFVLFDGLNLLTDPATLTAKKKDKLFTSVAFPGGPVLAVIGSGSFWDAGQALVFGLEALYTKSGALTYHDLAATELSWDDSILFAGRLILLTVLEEDRDIVLQTFEGFKCLLKGDSVGEVLPGISEEGEGEAGSVTATAESVASLSSRVPLSRESFLAVANLVPYVDRDGIESWWFEDRHKDYKDCPVEPGETIYGVNGYLVFTSHKVSIQAPRWQDVINYPELLTKPLRREKDALVFDREGEKKVHFHSGYPVYEMIVQLRMLGELAAALPPARHIIWKEMESEEQTRTLTALFAALPKISDMDSQQRENALAVTGYNEERPPLAAVDCTLIGNGKKALMLGRKGLYGNREDGAVFIPYEVLVKEAPQISLGRLSIGDSVFIPTCDQKALIKALQGIRMLLQRAASPKPGEGENATLTRLLPPADRILPPVSTPPREKLSFDEVAEILTAYPMEGRVLLEPKIPAKHLAPFMATGLLESDEDIVGLLRCSGVAASRRSVLFTDRALLLNDSQGLVRVYYEQLAAQPIGVHGNWKLTLAGGRVLHTPGLPVEALLGLLTALRDRVALEAEAAEPVAARNPWRDIATAVQALLAIAKPLTIHSHKDVEGRQTLVSACFPSDQEPWGVLNTSLLGDGPQGIAIGQPGIFIKSPDREAVQVPWDQISGFGFNPVEPHHIQMGGNDLGSFRLPVHMGGDFGHERVCDLLNRMKYFAMHGRPLRLPEGAGLPSCHLCGSFDVRAEQEDKGFAWGAAALGFLGSVIVSGGAAAGHVGYLMGQQSRKTRFCFTCRSCGTIWNYDMNTVKAERRG